MPLFRLLPIPPTSTPSTPDAPSPLLFSLPPELLLTITAQLITLHDALSFASTCRHLRVLLTQTPHARAVLTQITRKNVIEFNEFLRVVRAGKLGVKESGCFYDETEDMWTGEGGREGEGNAGTRYRGYIDPLTKEGICLGLLTGAASITSGLTVGGQTERETFSKESGAASTFANTPTAPPPTFTDLLSVIKLSELARHFELAISNIGEGSLYGLSKPEDDPLDGFRDWDESTKPTSDEIVYGARYQRARLYRGFARWLLLGETYRWAFKEAEEVEDEMEMVKRKEMLESAGIGEDGAPTPPPPAPAPAAATGGYGGDDDNAGRYSRLLRRRRPLSGIVVNEDSVGPYGWEEDDVPSVPDPEDNSQLCRLFKGFWEYLIEDGARRALEEGLAPIDMYDETWFQVGARFTSAQYGALRELLLLLTIAEIWSKLLTIPYDDDSDLDNAVSDMNDGCTSIPRVLQIHPFGCTSPASILLPKDTRKFFILDHPPYRDQRPVVPTYCFVQLALVKHFKVRIREDLFAFDYFESVLGKWMTLLTEAWTVEMEEERKENEQDPVVAIPTTFYQCLRKLEWDYREEEEE